MNLAPGQDEPISSPVSQPTPEKPRGRNLVQVETSSLDLQVERAVLINRPTGKPKR